MKTEVPKALLVGHLQAQGLGCEFASSSQEALSLVRIYHFHLVLSPIRLRDSSLFFLMDVLDGPEVTLFYFQAVEKGCWWLPAIRCGRPCLGSPALRPGEFTAVLDAVIDEVRFGLVGSTMNAEAVACTAATG